MPDTVAVVECSAPELTVGQSFNGGVLIAANPLPNLEGRYPSRIVLVDIGHEYWTWLAVWPVDREHVEWYCDIGHFFYKSELVEAASDLKLRTERGY